MATLEQLFEKLESLAVDNAGKEKITAEETSLMDKFILDKEREAEARDYFRNEGALKMPVTRLDALKHILRARLEITEVADIYENMLLEPPDDADEKLKKFMQWVAVHYLARMQKEKLIPADHATAIFTPALLFKESNREPPSKFITEAMVEELLYLHNDQASLLIVKALPDMFEVDSRYASVIVDKLDSFFPSWRDKVSTEVRQNILDIKTAKDIDDAPVTAVHLTDTGTPAKERKRIMSLVAGIIIVLVVVVLIIYFTTQT